MKETIDKDFMEIADSEIIFALETKLKNLQNTHYTLLTALEANRKERDELKEKNKALREVVMFWIEGEEFHDEDCPEDDTCDCKVANAVNVAMKK